MFELRHIPTRGKVAGREFLPHLYPDGMYVVSPTNREADQIRVPRSELMDHAARGLGIRMSEGGQGPRPSIIKPKR